MTERMRLIGRELACRRGGRLVFSGLSFEVASGEMLILRGPNGAGKTTLLRLIAGFTPPAAGELVLEGGLPDLSVGQQSHYIAHQNAIKPQLTVMENLRFWSRFHGGCAEHIYEAIEAMDLAHLSHYAAALLSAGQKRRLALARLLLAKRPIWLLDEPTVGLDAASVARLQGLMERHLDDGGIVIATTHIDLGMAAARVFEFAACHAAEETVEEAMEAAP